MLRIENIRKQYKTGELVQTALDGVSLTLRDNEFVAILGPSGSGKTTLLNVIGGLDRYDSGDLIIGGTSTKKYTDRDWDSYRNHTIGFIFQSYNLIPHQTVLQNVELALTISGISRSQRRKKAKAALEAVGLGDQLHKRPNQMSGGQMQRVAIARALVNDPDILLADEPTGALDTATSIQVMDLLKEVARDKLVVMVTHNPELAESYANRIVRVKDGRIVGDTNPYLPDEALIPPATHRNMGKASMSFLTALALSFNNLWTKKARTLLTAFAGSIGIIGIALILSLSTGFQNYIDKIQADTLTNYPLTLQEETADLSTAIAAIGSAAAQASEAEAEGTVVEQQMISQMFSNVGKNDLGAFKNHLESHFDTIGHTVSAVRYSYGVKPNIYLADTSEGIVQVNPSTMFGQLTGSSAMSAYMDSDIFYEMMDNYALLAEQYEVLRGRWPEGYNEMILVLSDPHRLPDYTAYALGLRDPAELSDMMATVMSGEEIETPDTRPMQWSYEELMALEFRLVTPGDKYSYNSQYHVWEDMSGSEGHMRGIISQGEPLRIVGIVCAKEGVSSTALSAGIAYTSALTRHVIDDASESSIVKSQLADTKTDVFTGTPFGEQREDEGIDFQDMISVDTEMIQSAFSMNVDSDAIAARVTRYLENALAGMTVDTAPAQADFTALVEKMGTEMLTDYIAANADPFTGTAKLKMDQSEALAEEYLAGPGKEKLAALAGKYNTSPDELAEMAQPLLAGFVAWAVADRSGALDTLIQQLPQQTQPPQAAPEPEAPADPTETTEEAEATETTDPTEATEQTQPTEGTEPSEPVDLPELPDLSGIGARISADEVPAMAAEYAASPVTEAMAAMAAMTMVEDQVRRDLTNRISGIGNVLMESMGGGFSMDESKFMNAFQFQMNEEEMRRLMEAMANPSQAASYAGNLRGLGYADLDEPTAISVYFVDFETKEEFIDFLDTYNGNMESSGNEDKYIRYADITGIMMSSVRTIIDSVSYALIAFVAVSLVVSSIMIGIITYISVMERTKEIGVLRAIGASKRNISQVFNAETFIIGLCSGLIGVGVTLLLLIPGNRVIQTLAENPDIVAVLPVTAALILIALSMALTLIGGLIPAKQAAKKDPVIALRSE